MRLKGMQSIHEAFFSAEYLHHLTTLCQLDMRCCDWLNGDDAANHSEVKQELPCQS